MKRCRFRSVIKHHDFGTAHRLLLLLRVDPKSKTINDEIGQRMVRRVGSEKETQSLATETQITSVQLC